MKKGILVAIIFWFVPVAFLITILFRREPTYHGVSASVWLGQMGTNQDVALNALQHIGKSALPILKDVLNSSARTDRCRAAMVLGKMGDAAGDAVPDLIRMLDDDCPSVQCEAMMALTRIGVTNEDLASKLVGNLTNNQTGPFSAALLNSIEYVREAHNLPRLSTAGYDYGMACLKSSVPSMRLNGAIQLESVVQTDARAKSALQSLLCDENYWVRQEVARLMLNPDIPPNFKLVSE